MATAKKTDTEETTTDLAPNYGEFTLEAAGELEKRLESGGKAAFFKLKDGRTIEHETLAAKGTAENPLTREDVTEKALDLMAPVLGKKRSLALIAALFDLDTLPNVRALRRLYTA